MAPTLAEEPAIVDNGADAGLSDALNALSVMDTVAIAATSDAAAAVVDSVDVATDATDVGARMAITDAVVAEASVVVLAAADPVSEPSPAFVAQLKLLRHYVAVEALGVKTRDPASQFTAYEKSTLVAARNAVMHMEGTTQLGDIRAFTMLVSSKNSRIRDALMHESASIPEGDMPYHFLARLWDLAREHIYTFKGPPSLLVHEDHSPELDLALQKIGFSMGDVMAWDPAKRVNQLRNFFTSHMLKNYELYEYSHDMAKRIDDAVERDGLGRGEFEFDDAVVVDEALVRARDILIQAGDTDADRITRVMSQAVKWTSGLKNVGQFLHIVNSVFFKQRFEQRTHIEKASNVRQLLISHPQLLQLPALLMQVCNNNCQLPRHCCPGRILRLRSFADHPEICDIHEHFMAILREAHPLTNQ